MIVNDILKQKGYILIGVSPQATIAEAAGIMRREQVGALVVLADDGAFRGMISEREIVAELAKRGNWSVDLPVQAIMATNVPLAGPEDSVAELMETMTTHRARHIPVVQDGAVIGVVSVGDAVKFRLQEKVAENAVLRDMARAHLMAA